MKSLRIATRNSPLALWQAHFVKQELNKHHSDIDIEIIGMTTRGDQLLASPLAKIGGKGLFVKELENALLENRADIAVHSMKDVGVTFPPGLDITCIMSRHNPYDAFVSNNYNSLSELPEQSIVGTCSLRRICQLKNHFPHLSFKTLRGNVNTRLSKLDNGEYDAIILAAAGLERLDMHDRIAEVISDTTCLPAIAQGSLGIETRIDDKATRALLAPLADETTTIQATAERAVNEVLNGSCQNPIAAFATITGTQLTLRALVGSSCGRKLLTTEQSGSITHAQEIGERAGHDLLDQGAQALLDNL